MIKHTIEIEVPEGPIDFATLAGTIFADMKMAATIYPHKPELAASLDTLVEALCRIAPTAFPMGRGKLREQLEARWAQDFGNRENGMLGAFNSFQSRIHTLPPDEEGPPGRGG